MRKNIFILAFGISWTSLATAMVTQPAQEDFSRALQQAKRVASLENNQSIPAPAVKLSQRVAQNSRRLALQSNKKSPQKSKKTSRN